VQSNGGEKGRTKRGTILVIATLDTKEREVCYITEAIQARGHSVLVMDVSGLGLPSIKPDIARQTVADAAGAKVEDLANLRRDIVMDTMANGAAKICKKLYDQGGIDGVIGFGGNQGTMIVTTAMRALPVGFPKVVVSTIASGNVRPYVGDKDIAMIFSVADLFGGVNMVTRTILSNAAGAVLGMCEVGVKMPTVTQKKVVGITAFGSTNGAASKALESLTKRGYEPIVFHASGAGGSAMEELITQGTISGVLDLTPHELVAEIFPRACDVYAPVNPGRLEAAGRSGIPQVIAPGGLEYFVYGPPESVPPEYRDRKTHFHNPYNLNVRVSKQELEITGKVMAQRLNKANGPVAVIIPLRGWSERSGEGAPLYDPCADRMFVQSLRQHLKDSIPVLEVNCHINDPQFAEESVEILDKFMRRPGQTNAICSTL
jgi:uncharacterized protein (UPF0261 family)